MIIRQYQQMSYNSKKEHKAKHLIVRRGRAVQREEMLNKSVNYKLIPYSPLNKPRAQDYHIETIKKLESEVENLKIELVIGGKKSDNFFTSDQKKDNIKKQALNLENLLIQKEKQISSLNRQLKTALQIISQFEEKEKCLKQILNEKQRTILQQLQLINNFNPIAKLSTNTINFQDAGVKFITSVQQLHNIDTEDYALKDLQNIPIPDYRNKMNIIDGSVQMINNSEKLNKEIAVKQEIGKKYRKKNIQNSINMTPDYGGNKNKKDNGII